MINGGIADDGVEPDRYVITLSADRSDTEIVVDLVELQLIEMLERDRA